MAIANRYSVYDVLGLDNSLWRNHGQNPRPSYRELLAAEPSDEMKAAFPDIKFVAYGIEFAADGIVLAAIPHGLTTVTGDPIIPDVVIPVLAANVSVDGELPTLLPGAVALMADGSLGYNTNGGFADDEYVYLLVSGTANETTRFLVYVEWTHSVIKNEIVTGEATYLASAEPQL